MRARVSISVCIAVLAGVGAVHCVGDEPKVGVVGDDDGGGVTGDGGGGSGGDGAIGDGGSGSDAAPSVIDVDGTLVLPSDDDTSPSTAPLANRQIVVLDANGVLTKVTSGADGKFHVGGVKTPYDTLVPFDAPDAGGIVTPVYIGGLTRSNPTLFGVPFGPRVSPEHSATIAFSENVPTGSTIVVSAGEYNHPNPGTGSTQIFNSFAATWYGPSTTTTASVGLLQYDSSGTFTKFGLVGMQTFTDGVTKALGSPTLAALGANKTVTITATPPGTYSISSNLARFVTADNTFLGTSEAATATATLNVPPLLSTQVFLESQANGPNNSQSTAFVTYADYTTMPATMSFTLPAAQVLLTPTNNGTGVKPTDKLTWTASTLPGGYEVVITDTKGMIFPLFVTTPELDLGRLQQMGYTLPSGVTYTWFVGKNADGTSDDLAQPGGVPPLAPGVVGYSTTSVANKFTTQ